MSVPQKSFIQAIKSKIIIALLLACFALFMAWGVSKVVFNEMLDTMNSLYKNDSLQNQRIKSIGILLNKRDKQLQEYLKVREGLVNNKSFSTEVKKLNSLVSRNSEQPDSTVVTTEQRTSTTTIYPKEEKPKGFLNRIFGKKRSEGTEALRVVNQEKVRRDTISIAKDTVARTLEKSLMAIEKAQKKKSATFLNREAVLSYANDTLISQMLKTLKVVESEVVQKVDSNGLKAKRVMNDGIQTIGIIMLVFFLLTILLLYFILTDITRSNRYRKQLELAKDEAEYHSIAKQRFLSNMSHEIRTPLQSIIGYAELLKQQTNPRQKDIDAISQSSEHLLQIVNEVLDYNRLTSGKFSFSQKTFHIGRLLEEVVSAMQPQVEKKSLVLRSELDLDPLSYLKGDPFRLKQILYNLIGNAIKFTHVGEVVLSAFYKRQGSQLHFTFIVKDTGIGFSEAESKKIFNEFEQVEAPDRDALNQAGAGLGLNIVKALVDNQGGRIYVKSKEGLGSSFTVYLTFEIAEDKPLSLPQAVAAGDAVRGSFAGKVWVIDDDQLILDLCALIFQKNNIRYQSFQSPAVMLETPWQPEVTHILMDIRMSEISGIVLCKTFRQRLGDSVKIFAMTAQVLDHESDQLLKEGFDGILQKPFKEQDLLTVFGASFITADTFDPTVLEKMTFGDRDQLNKILKRFAEDCIADIAALRQSLHAQRIDELSLVVHRLAGRIAQVGAKQLAGDFRLAEAELAKNGLESSQKNRIEGLITGLENLLRSIGSRS
jgi:signal transduction histidine kinase/CheY-like chemotaxis protein